MGQHIEVDIEKITPFAINADIYGDTDPSNLKTEEQKISFAKLVESINEVGLLRPVVIDQNYTLISGERRLSAHKFLGLTKIKAEMFNYSDDYTRVKHLLYENLYREKTIMQKIREGEVREQLIREKKKEALEESGKNTVRDVVGEEIGLSGKTYQMGTKVLERIKELEAEGHEDEAEELEAVANKSVSGALRKIKSEKPTKEEANEDYIYWYKNRLRSLISVMNSTTAFFKKNAKSTESKYFLDFVDKIDEHSAFYGSWIDLNIDCKLCNGEGCKACKEGKTGIIE